MTFFGPLIGYGASGLVFAHAQDKDQVIKLVYLPDRDPEDYEEFANQQQSKLFEELADLPEDTPIGLPKVSHYMEGKVSPWLQESVTNQIADPEAQEIFDEEFTSGRKFGLWMMERVPHREDNQYGSYESPNEQIPEVWSLSLDQRAGWRTRDYQNYVPIEQQHYRDMSRWLLDRGWIVRDVKQLRNLGYRDNGTPVWFDPNVVSWPSQTQEDKDAFGVIFSGFTPESIGNEITSGQYVENRRNAESRFDSVNDFELLQTFQVVQPTLSINWFMAQPSSPTSSTMQNYRVDLCSGTGGDHDYGPAYEWDQDMNDDEGVHYQITCQECGLIASAEIDMSANGLDKINSFYWSDDKAEMVWQDPYKDIWYSHTKPPILDAAGDIIDIPY
jgi:hypothetical protein